MDVLCREFPEMSPTVVNHYLDRCNGSVESARARLLEAESECKAASSCSPGQSDSALSEQTSPGPGTGSAAGGHAHQATLPSSVGYINHIPGCAVPTVDYLQAPHPSVRTPIIRPNSMVGTPPTFNRPHMMSDIAVVRPPQQAHTPGCSDHSSQRHPKYSPSSHERHVSAGWPGQLPGYGLDAHVQGSPLVDRQGRQPVSYAGGGHVYHPPIVSQNPSPGNGATGVLPRLTMPDQGVPLQSQSQPVSHGFPAAQYIPPWAVASSGQPSPSPWTGGQNAIVTPARISSPSPTAGLQYQHIITPTHMSSSADVRARAFTPIIPSQGVGSMNNPPTGIGITGGVPAGAPGEPLPGTSDHTYTNALVVHQRERVERIRRAVDHVRTALKVLQDEVQAKRMSHSSFVQANSGLPSEDQVYMAHVEKSTLAVDVDDLHSQLNSIGVSKLPPADVEEERWACEHCTFLNHPAMTARCEFCEIPRT